MIYHDIPQASQEWVRLRLGVPTASNFHRILTPKTRKMSAQAADYILELIGERVSQYLPERCESFTSRATDWGRNTEEEARNYLAMDMGLDVKNGGFCLTDDGRFGASPDGLVDPDGAIELKCPATKTHLAYLIGGKLPDEYKTQVHGQLIVTGRKWVQFVSYDPTVHDHKAFSIRVEPDDFTEELRSALEIFWADYQAALEKINALA